MQWKCLLIRILSLCKLCMTWYMEKALSHGMQNCQKIDENSLLANIEKFSFALTVIVVFNVLC